jgi:AcrR family transcriptional regulator
VGTDGRRAEATAATRRGIVDAAQELLATQQWQHFTVEAVANRAGVTRVTVYNQLGSKRGLLNAVLADLTARAGMDQLLTDTQHRTANEACAVIVRRTCRFWHSERNLLRPLFGLAGVDREVASVLAQREQWRGNQMQRLVQRLTTETATASPSFDQRDVLAGVVALTSFPAYDALGAVADDPDRAALLLNHLVRSLTGS